MANKIVKLLRKQHPDPSYVKKIFQYVRETLNLKGGQPRVKHLPKLLTNDELKRFYEAVRQGFNRVHVIMLKLLLFTGIRNAELSNIKLTDITLGQMKIRITKGKRVQDRYVLFPPHFRGELTQYVAAQKEEEAEYLFESNRNAKFTTRWIREITKKYAMLASITKRIHPQLFRHQILTYLTSKGIVDAKIQLISGHRDRESLSIYQDLSLSDVGKEYQTAMKDFTVQYFFGI